MTRDEIMRLLQECGFGTLLDHPIMTENMMRFGSRVAAAEREACAKVCEILGAEDDSFYAEFSRAKDCAAAIRAREKQ